MMRTLLRALAATVVAGSMLASLPSSTRAADSFSDIADSKFKASIEWLVSEGITSGCGGGKFCPKGTVTRGQMASFLSRFLQLPAYQGPDIFSDDNGNLHEANINRLAAAGITAGCGGSKFCPHGAVTREQMASFLTRALKLKHGGANDFFADDDWSSHQANIDRLLTADITRGCALNRFCPTGIVLREQLAAFLHRASRVLDAPAGKSDEVVGNSTVTFAAGDYHGYQFNADFSAISATKADIVRSKGSATAGRRALIDGHRYHLIASGRWADFWMPTMNGIALRAGRAMPSCAYGEVLTEHRDLGHYDRTLVDLRFEVQPSYTPTDLVPVTNSGARYGPYGQQYARNILMPDLTELVSAVRAAGFGQLKINSAFRDYNTQAAWWNNYLNGGGSTTYPTTLPPGHSEHQLGTTLDIDVYTASGLNAWMTKNAYKYGFVKSYPPGKNAKHCIGSEDWHWRYLGRSTAAAMTDSGLTIREWQWFVHNN